MIYMCFGFCLSVLYYVVYLFFFFFFFQAEDGIRDGTVTGVQTCALPICGAQEAALSASVRARLADGVLGLVLASGLRIRAVHPGATAFRILVRHAAGVDRKSTRLNSSHSSISYAVFCLKKKTTSSASLSF